MTKHRTTETLRAMLFDAIDDLRSGKITSNDAKSIAVLADKIIDTAELELKHSEIVSKLDKDDQGIQTGPLLLTQAAEQGV